MELASHAGAHALTITGCVFFTTVKRARGLSIDNALSFCSFSQPREGLIY